MEAMEEEEKKDDEPIFFECEDASSEILSDFHSARAEAAQEPSRLYECLVKRPCCGQCLTRFPRTCAVFLGVVMPLISLTFVSLGFGAILADFEGPEEIKLNDQALEKFYVAQLQKEAVINLTMVLPRFCYAIYMEEQRNETIRNSSLESRVPDYLDSFLRIDSTHESPSDSLLIPDAHGQFLEDNKEQFDMDNPPTNSTEFFQHMVDCGLQAGSITRELLEQYVPNTVDTDGDFTFNWIRCYEGSNETTLAGSGKKSVKSIFRGESLVPEQRSFEAQAKYYFDVWELDRQRLYQEYYNSFSQDTSLPPAEVRALASGEAARDASGGDACVLNVPAAAWFWFTVQTTVGYGNQAPVTAGGRALVFTVGFISMLAFAGLLGSAGYILAYLFDDFMERSGARFLAIPWISCILWGAAYYQWMVAIAAYTIQWKYDRLDIHLDRGDAYWFSYISTTTVGLGDIFLEPEGINGPDVFIFSMLFLIGFTFLAAFLAKFSQLVLSLAGKGRTSFVDTLLVQRVEWRKTFANRKVAVAETDANGQCHEK